MTQKEIQQRAKENSDMYFDLASLCLMYFDDDKKAEESYYW